MSTPQYTYLCTDLVSNKVLGELPVLAGGTSFDLQFNSPGNFSCTVGLDDPVVSNDFLIGNTIPGRTSVWAYREDRIVWGGIIWTRVYNSPAASSPRSLQLTAQTFDTYAARRYPRDVWGKKTHTYKRGQCAIINSLWTKMQGVPHGDIDVAPAAADSLPKNDPIRTLVVKGDDMSSTFADVIGKLLSFSNGPDYVIEWREDGFGLPRKRLRLGNQLGRYLTAFSVGGRTGQPSLVVDYPDGSVLSYTYTENAASGANKWWVVGSATGAIQSASTRTSATVIGSATNNKSLRAGWPLLEQAVSDNGTTNLEALNDRAMQKLSHRPTPLVTHTINLDGTELPEFGTYELGDWFGVNISDARFPSGITFTKRVVGWSVSPPDTNAGVETVSLVYDEPTATN